MEVGSGGSFLYCFSLAGTWGGDWGAHGFFAASPQATGQMILLPILEVLITKSLGSYLYSRLSSYLLPGGKIILMCVKWFFLLYFGLHFDEENLLGSRLWTSYFSPGCSSQETI